MKVAFYSLGVGKVKRPKEKRRPHWLSSSDLLIKIKSILKLFSSCIKFEGTSNSWMMSVMGLIIVNLSSPEWTGLDLEWLAMTWDQTALHLLFFFFENNFLPCKNNNYNFCCYKQIEPIDKSSVLYPTDFDLSWQCGVVAAFYTSFVALDSLFSSSAAFRSPRSFGCVLTSDPQCAERFAFSSDRVYRLLAVLYHVEFIVIMH